MAKVYVAVTGGIGSGKSLVLQFLQKLNYPVFSCDELYKQVIQSEAYVKTLQCFFPEAVESGKVDRQRLSKIVFQDQEKLKQLNALAHPLIMDLLMSKMKEVDGDIVFAEVPLLFEGNFEKLFQHVIYITRDKQERIASILMRDGISINEAEKRIASQFDGTSEEGQKRLKACNAKIILNNGSIEEIEGKILEILNTL